MRLFSAAGFTLDPESVPKLVAAKSSPGRWRGRKWLAGNGKEEGWSLWPSAWLGRLKRRRLPGAGTPPVKPSQPPHSPDSEQIPVHWPTLFRSRQLAQEESEARGPHPLYNPARDANNPFHPSHFSRPSRPPSGNESEDEFDESDAVVVYPKQLWQLRDHSAKVYACAVRGQWLITGARDKYVNIYHLPRLPNDGSKPTAGPELVLREKVHGSSVLHLDFILDVNSIRNAVAEAGLDFPFDGKRRGLLVTSATETVFTWDIIWPQSSAPTTNENGEPVKPPAPKLRQRATLLGSEAPVSDVKLHGPWVCVMYVNGLCRIYSATATGDAIPLRTVFAGESCHLMALHAGRVLLAGDERTVEFDLHSGREMGRSKRNTAGRVTSMDWDVSTPLLPWVVMSTELTTGRPHGPWYRARHARALAPSWPSHAGDEWERTTRAPRAPRPGVKHSSQRGVRRPSRVLGSDRWRDAARVRSAMWAHIRPRQGRDVACCVSILSPLHRFSMEIPEDSFVVEIIMS